MWTVWWKMHCQKCWKAPTYIFLLVTCFRSVIVFVTHTHMLFFRMNSADLSEFWLMVGGQYCFFSVLWVMNVTFHFASMTYANEINVFSTKIQLYCQIYRKLIVSEAIIFWRKGCVCSECHHSLKCQCWIHNMKWETISGGTDSRTETHEFPKMKAMTKHSWGGQSTLLAEVIKVSASTDRKHFSFIFHQSLACNLCASGLRGSFVN